MVGFQDLIYSLRYPSDIWGCYILLRVLLLFNIIIIYSIVYQFSCWFNHHLVKLKYDICSSLRCNSTWESFQMEDIRIWLSKSMTTIILRRKWREGLGFHLISIKRHLIVRDLGGLGVGDMSKSYWCDGILVGSPQWTKHTVSRVKADEKYRGRGLSPPIFT